MTAPREVLPGQCYLLTRRCTQRQFLLRPDRETKAVFAYCLAEAAKRYGIELIAWLAMSNHYHAVVHDPEAKLPAFLEHFHKMVAKALNAKWGRRENFWSSEPPSVVLLATPQDVFDKVVYVLANPIADDLVEQIRDWPGCSSMTQLNQEGEVQEGEVHARPTSFFSASGTMPVSVELRAVYPKSIRGRESVASWTSRVRAALAERERFFAEARRRERRRVLGRHAVLRTSASDAASKPEPARATRPLLACKDGGRREIEEQRLKLFYALYRDARRRFSSGEHRVEFPPGTYRLRMLGAKCAAFPSLKAA